MPAGYSVDPSGLDVVDAVVDGVAGVVVVESLVKREVTVPRVLTADVVDGRLVVLDVVGMTSGTSWSVMRMSEQARNCSWGPQPIIPVPLGHVPQLLPAT